MQIPANIDRFEATLVKCIGIYAECPAFQGCHVEGETYEETISEIKQVLTGFVEEYKKSGEEIPLDNYSIASVRVPV